MRWTTAEADIQRTGLDVATFELDRARLAFLRLALRADAMDTIRDVDGGAALGLGTAAEIATCSAVGLLRSKSHDSATTPSPGPRLTAEPPLFEGGRVMQRIWLSATRMNVALQPYDLVWLLKVASSESAGASRAARANAKVLTDEYERIFGATAATDLIVFRLTAGLPAPSTLSLRRRLHDVLTFRST